MKTITSARKGHVETISDAERLRRGRANLSRLRARAAKQIDRLIELLDATGPDADLEDDDPLEPNLAGFELCLSQCDDAEADDADDEPLLGSGEDHPNGYYDGADAKGWRRSQEFWASGNCDDREDEHDGAEPEHEDYDGRCDDEPSLGSTNDYLGNGTSYVVASVPDAEGPEEDLEPSLCGVTVTASLGNDRDLEEDDSDREPSLGWPEGHVAHGPGMLGHWDDRELAA